MKNGMRLAVTALAALLAACGDGDGPRTSAVRVAGDSLSDSGTYGFKFTVQDGLNGSRIWVDHVADAAGVAAPCARHVALSEFSLAEGSAAANCTSYAVGKGRINVPDADVNLGGDATPFSIAHQLERMSQVQAFGPQELLLVDGGGNDVADLLRYFLAFGAELQPPLGPDATSFYQLLAERGVVPAAPDEAGLAEAGGRYMRALADQMADDLALAIERGARRVVLLDIPQLTKTPYLRVMVPVLTGMLGGDAAASAKAARVMVMVDGWIRTFNDRLRSRFAGEDRVVVVDLYASFGNWVDRPADFGFTDSSSIACPPEPGKVDGLGLPVYLLGNCQAWWLSAYPPAGASSPDWWTGYVFSDDFHGSPMTNRLMGDLVVQQLREHGWL